MHFEYFYAASLVKVGRNPSHVWLELLSKNISLFLPQAGYHVWSKQAFILHKGTPQNFIRLLSVR